MSLHQDQIFAGRYRLVHHLGTGGFAQVWKAQDTMAEDGVVAIKVFAPDKGMDADGIKVFRREFALTLPLSHPHLLKTYHFDVFEGSPYLIMPFCREGSLMGKIADQHDFSERELAELMHQMAGALRHLHQEGINHQDIKPDNILILREGHYVLSDFGISTRAKRTVARSMRAEQARGYSAFTPAYAPPEKYTAKPSPQGDIFSLGVSLYELASGDVPFEDIGAALERNATIPTLPASFTAGFNQFLMACMAIKPEERPSAEQLEKAARNFIHTGKWPGFETVSPKKDPLPSRRQTQKMPDIPEIAVAREPKEMVAAPQSKASPKTSLPRKILVAGLIISALAASAYFAKGLINKENPNRIAFTAASMAGDSLMQAGNYSGAREKWEYAQQLIPADSSIPKKLRLLSTLESSRLISAQKHISKADSLFDAGEFSAAISKYQEALSIAPGNNNWEQKEQTARDSMLQRQARASRALAFEDSLSALRENEQKAIAKKRAPYSFIGDFLSTGFAVAKSRENGKYGLINRNFEPVIPLIYGNIQLCSNGLLIVTKQASWEVENYTKLKKAVFTQQGKALTPFKYKDIECFSEGMAAVNLNKGYGDFPWGYINEQGQEVIPPKYFNAGQFKGGRARVSEQNKIVLPASAGARYYIDKSGNCVIDCP